MSNLEKEIREANIEIVQATKHRDSLKTEVKEARNEELLRVTDVNNIKNRVHYSRVLHTQSVSYSTSRPSIFCYIRRTDKLAALCDRRTIQHRVA